MKRPKEGENCLVSTGHCLAKEQYMAIEAIVYAYREPAVAKAMCVIEALGFDEKRENAVKEQMKVIIRDFGMSIINDVWQNVWDEDKKLVLEYPNTPISADVDR